MKKTSNKEDNHPAPIFKLSLNVLVEIFRSIGKRPAESGGMLGGKGEEITHYHFDETSRTSKATYTPDHVSLTNLLKNDWNPSDTRLKGFVHSHPSRFDRPSGGDQVYAGRILEAIDDLKLLWLPIVNTIPDTGRFSISPWAAVRDGDDVHIVKAQIEVTSSDANMDEIPAYIMDQIEMGTPLDRIVINKKAETDNPELTPDTTFDRVKDAYDLNLMRNTRIIAVGAGGAAEWLEQMARAGTGQFVLIDPDTVSATNLATQQTYRQDIGRSKVNCIAERILNINPAAKVVSIPKRLEELEDERIRSLASDSIDGCLPHKTIICGLTDNFFAQAQVNRVALQLGIPSLCAQVYREGRGIEITFTYPGVTPACHRCILSSRYRHYLEKGESNTVTSHGTPIFATAMLNAIKGYVALAIVHHASNHSRWGDVLSRIGNRNLIQLRLDPDFTETMGMKVFDRVFEHTDHSRLFFGEPVWLPQEQECPDTGYPHCPDCDGTGDLRSAVGKFEDTRLNISQKSTEASNGFDQKGRTHETVCTGE